MQSDGAPLRAHLQRQVTGLVPKPDVRDRLLYPPELPTVCAPLWADFRALGVSRQWTDKGPRPLTWEAMQAWLFVSKLVVSQSYITMLFLLDEIYLECWYKNKKGTSGK